MPAHGLMFHHFHDTLDHGPSQGSIDAAQLADLIRNVGRGRILPAMEFLERAISGRLNEHHVCLTFDDNLLCQYDVAVPVLEDFGLTAFWFVYTSVMQGNIERLEIYRHFRNTQFPTVDDFYAAFFIRVCETEFGRRTEGALRAFDPTKYLAAFPFYSEADRRFRFVRDEVLGADSYAQVMDAMMRDAKYDVRDVAKQLWMANEEIVSLHESGHIIGLHSHTHPTRMERLSEDDQRYEYKSNHSHLTALIGEPPLAMSHPCNSYNTTTLEILQSLGIKLGFRANMMTNAGFGPLEIPREDHANLIKRADEGCLMRITVFTSNQPRHISLIESLATIADEVFAIQECNTVFPGQVDDFFRKTPIMQDYFSRVIGAEKEVFGDARFPNRSNVRQLPIKMGDVSRLDMSTLAAAMRSDVFIVFGASYIKGPLCDALLERHAINIHMGVSPQYRGSSTNFWAMYDRRPEFVGATIHLLSKGLDSGPILFHALPKPAKVDPFVYGMLAVRAAHNSLIDKIAKSQIGDIEPIAQDRSKELRYTRNADFTDDVAAEYLSRLPTVAQMAAVQHDMQQFVRPVII